MKKLIEIIKNNGINLGYCIGCNKYFKKNDIMIIFHFIKFDKKIDKKLCDYCYLKLLADVIGWKEMSALIIKHTEKNI